MSDFKYQDMTGWNTWSCYSPEFICHKDDSALQQQRGKDADHLPHAQAAEQTVKVYVFQSGVCGPPQLNDLNDHRKHRIPSESNSTSTFPAELCLCTVWVTSQLIKLMGAVGLYFGSHSDLIPCTWQESLHFDDLPRRRKGRLHQTPHEGVDQCRRDPPTPLHLIQDLNTQINHHQTCDWYRWQFI